MSRVVQSVSDLSSDSGRVGCPTRTRAPGGEALALSSPQLGIWFAQKLDPSSPAYNIGEYIEIDGPIVLPLFERALRQVVAEAQSLRLQFSEHAGEPRQIVGEPAAWPLPIIDVSARARRARRGRSMDEGRSGAAGRSGARAAVRLRAVQGIGRRGSSGMRATITSCWTASACGWWPAASPKSTRGLCAGRRGAGRARSVRSRRCWTRTPPIARPSSSRDDRQYWSEALAARPEPGSLTLSDRPSARSASFLRETAYLPRSCEDSAANVGRSKREQASLASWPRRRRSCCIASTAPTMW